MSVLEISWDSKLAVCFNSKVVVGLTKNDPEEARLTPTNVTTQSLEMVCTMEFPSCF